MHPRTYLQAGGALLVLLAVLGFLRPHLAGDFLSFDPLENWARAAAGIAGLLIAPLPMGLWKRWIAALAGVGFLGLAAWGVVVADRPEPNVFGLVHFEYPVDAVIHLFFGCWGVAAALLNRRPIVTE